MKFSPSKIGRGLSAASESLTLIAPNERLRPLRDQMIVEPLDIVHSTILIVHSDTKPVRGIVRAVGPGHYPASYLDKNGDRLPDHKRKERKEKAHGKHFVPTQVKVGDIVHLGGMEHKGYAFETFVHGSKLMVSCTERDVACIEA